MEAWFDGLSALEQTLFVIAVFATTVFVIQTVFTLFGIGETDDADPDQGAIADDVERAGGVPFGDIFTIRNGVSFLMGFGWGRADGVRLGPHAHHLRVPGGHDRWFGVRWHQHGVVGADVHAPARGESAHGTRRRAAGHHHAGGAGAPLRHCKVRVSVQDRLLECHAITDGNAPDRNSAVTVAGLAGSQLAVAGA